MKKTKQTRVLKILWRNKDNLTVGEISNQTELSKKQVYQALRRLQQRGLIKKQKVKPERVGFGVPPVQKIFININENQRKRIKGILKNG